jgi:glutathione peroxidase
MKSVFRFLIFLCASLSGAFFAHAAPKASDQTAYDFSFESLTGEPMPLSAYKGKVLLVVNTASKCGFTKQYEALEALYTKYKDQGLVVIGVPSNDFGGQEPGSNAEIKQFCQLNYGVSFPMASKYAVTGDKAHPFYGWVREVLGLIATPKWNFYKYLVNREGKITDYFVSTTSPNDAALIAEVEKQLAAKPGASQ